MRQQNGEALAKDIPLIEWSDVSTPRWPSVVDNLMGESIQLHRDHFMEDVQQTRPVFVAYRSAANYIVEALVVALLAAGAWAARRERFFRMVASWVAFDMLMHLGFGFGLNEVYIMTAHWAFVIPIAAAYLMRRTPTDSARHAEHGTHSGTRRMTVSVPRLLVAALTVWLWAYNATLVAQYLLQ